MRTLSLTALAALALVVVSCDTTPVEPPGVEGSEVSPQFSANQVWVTGSFAVSNFLNVSCLGEEIHFFGDVPYKWHRVFNAGGGYNDLFIFVPSTPKAPFLAEGLTSGTVWETRGGTDPATYHAGPGEVSNLVINETYISKESQTFQVSGVIRMTFNANGELTASKNIFEAWCTGQS